MDTPRAVGLALAALHRGGEDKTTAAVNLSAFVTDHGQRTLIMDTAPQGQAAVGVGAFDVVLVDAPPSVWGSDGLERAQGDGGTSRR
ncbi:AAA family ATPase [Nonomuraea sp. NPDC005692]|uniref:AAA family ATPase n=1 Tax=Nonomuraea sp. NPDC005692 TaxID=3157168 RepID=UPI0033F98D4C